LVDKTKRDVKDGDIQGGRQNCRISVARKTNGW
jgi:hypothetical protein